MKSAYLVLQRLMLATSMLLLLTLSAAAQAPAPAAAAAPKLDSGDTAWMLTSMALVLMMTVPGLALFYGGMVRKMNVLATVMQSFAVTCLVTVLWMIIGYSFAFTSGSPFLGGTSRFLLYGMTLDSVNDLAKTIPESVYMCFQMTFAIITPALICGAFAGGTVVHITSGFAGLMAALVMGRRRGFATEPMPPHNLVLSVIGASLLWVGWVGFNARSGTAANGNAGMAMAVTQIATATAALAWMFAEWVMKGKPSVLGIISGAVAGLV